VEARSSPARAQTQLGDPLAALAVTAARRYLSFPTEEPTMRLLEGVALLELDRVDEAVRAFSAAQDL
jgi:Flp pilus assembly protein TadD